MANIKKLENDKRERENGVADVTAAGDGGENEKEENPKSTSNLLQTRSLLNENKLPLVDMKVRVGRNLDKLATHEIVKKEDNYQAVVNLIARVYYSCCCYSCYSCCCCRLVQVDIC